jgi:hypothetical protein
MAGPHGPAIPERWTVNKIVVALAAVALSLPSCAKPTAGPAVTESTGTSYVYTTVPSQPRWVIKSGPWWDDDRPGPWFRCVLYPGRTREVERDVEIKLEVWQTMSPVAKVPGVPCPVGLDRSER